MLFSLSCATRTVYIKKAPPVKKTEIKTPKPGNNFVWVEGYWKWNPKRDKYVWNPGFWKKIEPGKRWQNGHWKRAPKGWIWVKGYWN